MPKDTPARPKMPPLHEIGKILPIQKSSKMPDRLFVVTMNMHGVDHENFGSNEETRRTVTQETILSYPNQGLSVLEFIHGWGGECRFELRLTATLLGDKTIRVQGNALLYEGISEGTTELDGHREVSFIVPKG